MNKTASLNKGGNILSKLSFAAYIAAISAFIILSASLIWFYKNLTAADLGPNWLAIVTALSILVLGLCFLVILWFLWKSSHTAENPSIVRSLSMALGCVSAVSLAVMAVALGDIGKQTEAGFSSLSEWTMILLGLIATFLFLALSAPEIIKSQKADSVSTVKNDDILFISINEVGMICSLMSLLAIVFGFIVPMLEQFREHILVIFTVIAFLPWGLMILFWFVSRRKKVSSWWDEKQMTDMGRSSFYALISVVAISAALYALGLILPSFDAAVVWFPAVIISAVAVFSSFNVVYSR